MQVVNTSQPRLKANIPLLGDVDNAGNVVSPRSESFIVQVHDSLCIFLSFRRDFNLVPPSRLLKLQQATVDPLLVYHTT